MSFIFVFIFVIYLEACFGIVLEVSFVGKDGPFAFYRSFVLIVYVFVSLDT